MLTSFLSFFVYSCSGGVTICGVNYPCGVRDGICPNSFGSCCFGDPDCSSLCTGTKPIGENIILGSSYQFGELKTWSYIISNPSNCQWSCKIGFFKKYDSCITCTNGALEYGSSCFVSGLSGVCQSGIQRRTCDGGWSDWICIQNIFPSDEICDNGFDDDCDGVIDGCDGNCPEGSNNFCCSDGVDNDGDTFIDEDDNGCCSFCKSNLKGFDSFYGSECSSLTFNWADINLSNNKPGCCGDDFGEFYITDGIGDAACCNSVGDCVDINGNCQINNEETFSLCINGLDDDCDGNIDVSDSNCNGVITGYVFDEEGRPLVNAEVRTFFQDSTISSYEINLTTALGGFYNLSNALIGSYSLSASMDSYDTSVKIITLASREHIVINFNLKNGNCHADCSDYNGNCNPECDGVVFPDGTCNIDPLCNFLPKNSVVRYSLNGIVQELTCCLGRNNLNSTNASTSQNSIRTYAEMKISVDGNMDDIYDHISTVLWKGQYVKMHVLTWKNLN